MLEATSSSAPANSPSVARSATHSKMSAARESADSTAGSDSPPALPGGSVTERPAGPRSKTTPRSRGGVPRPVGEQGRLAEAIAREQHTEHRLAGQLGAADRSRHRDLAVDDQEERVAWLTLPADRRPPRIEREAGVVDQPVRDLR